jgi:hypothetical protein
MTIPLLGDEFLESSKNSTISLDHKKIKVNSLGILAKDNFNFTIKHNFPTMHTNSLTAMIALTDDILITSSYDRTIRVIQVSTGN